MGQASVLVAASFTSARTPCVGVRAQPGLRALPARAWPCCQVQGILVRGLGMWA